MAIAFSCPSCAKKFKVKNELSGRTVKCPCGAGFKVPRVRSRVQSQSQQKGRDSKLNPMNPDRGELIKGFDSGVFGDLLDEVDLGKTTVGKKCPSCREPIGSKAILCVQCGYRLDTGKQLKAYSNPNAGKSEKAKK